MKMHWIDMHAHLDKLEEGIDAAILLAQTAGVSKIVTIGTDPGDLKTVLEISKKYYPKVFCTLGIHPHEGQVYTQEIEDFITQNASEPQCIAIGEIGLDYYYNHSNKEDQKHAFRSQMKIAQKMQLPVEIHTRDAEEDTIEILKEFKGDVRGIIHCFTGTQWLADQALKLGYNISISGVATFKNAESLRSVIKGLPLDRIHIETDAPFLAPVPMRGKKNTPAYVVHTAEFVAAMMGVSLERLAEQTEKNAITMFPKMNVKGG